MREADVPRGVSRCHATATQLIADLTLDLGKIVIDYLSHNA